MPLIDWTQKLESAIAILALYPDGIKLSDLATKAGVSRANTSKLSKLLKEDDRTQFYNNVGLCCIFFPAGIEDIEAKAKLFAPRRYNPTKMHPTVIKLSEQDQAIARKRQYLEEFRRAVNDGIYRH